MIRQRIDELRLTPRQLRLSLEHVHRIRDPVLLQVQLRERRDCCLALGVDFQGLVTAVFSGLNVLLPLVECETLVDDRQGVDWGVPEASDEHVSIG